MAEVIARCYDKMESVSNGTKDMKQQEFILELVQTILNHILGVH